MIDELNAVSERLQAQSEELTAALVQSASTKECPEFCLKLQGATQITELTFTDRALRTAPTALREKLLAACAELESKATSGLANRVARITGNEELAAGIRAHVSVAITDDEEPGTTERDRAGGVQAGNLTDEQLLAWVENNIQVDDSDSFSFDDLFDDVPGWDPNNRINPHTAQAEFEAEIARIQDQAKGLAQRLEQIEVTESNSHLSVVVSGHGKLIDVVFRPRFGDAGANELSKEFLKLYSTACVKASTEALGLVAVMEPDSENPAYSVLQKAHDEFKNQQDRVALANEKE
ncbi:hypothetical protein HMPREF1531_01229 [Propionibacterium sp. oral taxon 192 str. F0372]|nr:hypothetical protein HMPREF1531_01229 [Propionibacterium sp. oral taxon 192 str. F0372]